jgi:hypothetical protein
MGIMSAVKMVEFGSERMSYIILRFRCFCITVLNAHAPKEHETHYVNHSLYEDLERKSDTFRK